MNDSWALIVQLLEALSQKADALIVNGFYPPESTAKQFKEVSEEIDATAHIIERHANGFPERTNPDRPAL